MSDVGEGVKTSPSNNDPEEETQGRIVVEQDDVGGLLSDLLVLKELDDQLPLDDVLGLHVKLCSGQERMQQVDMLNTVSEVFAQENPVWGFVEAGTGTGKSYAYLIPSALLPGRYLIATSTNQLGEQLVKKDLPAVRETLKLLGYDFRYELLKGKNNYVCKMKVKQAEDLEEAYRRSSQGGHVSEIPQGQYSSDLFGNEPEGENLSTDKRGDFLTPPKKSKLDSEGSEYDSGTFTQLYEWVKSTRTGERSEGPSVTDKVWSSVSISSSECLQKECPFYSECYAYDAVKRAERAKVVVTNHAYLAHSSSAMEDMWFGNDNYSMHTQQPSSVALPLSGKADYDGYVIDEAHDFPSAVSDSLTETILPSSVWKVVKNFHNALRKKPLTSGGGEHISQGVILPDNIEVVQMLCTNFEKKLNNMPLGVDVRGESELFDMLGVLKAAILKTVPPVDFFTPPTREEDGDVRGVSSAQQMMHLGKVVEVVRSLSAFMTASESESSTVWCEELKNDTAGGGKPVVRQGRVLKLAHTDVGDIIFNRFHERKVVATSATLKFNDSFDSFITRFGGDKVNSSNSSFGGCSVEVVEKDVGAVFNYKQQGLLYIPRIFPEPVGSDRVEHVKGVKSELKGLISALGGRTLALFTTGREAKDVAEYLRGEFPHLNILKYGDKPASVLVSEFVNDETSVLCGTMGLWQGVDAPGFTCSLVFINKVAFPPPTDVLTRARMDKVEKNGGNGFTDIMVPDAAQTLAQAAGRLIRKETDRGVVAITDPRLLTKRYGENIIKSLPNFTFTTNKDEVLKFLRAERERSEQQTVGEYHKLGVGRKGDNSDGEDGSAQQVSAVLTVSENVTPPVAKVPIKKSTLKRKTFKKPS